MNVTSVIQSGGLAGDQAESLGPRHFLQRSELRVRYGEEIPELDHSSLDHPAKYYEIDTFHVPLGKQDRFAAAASRLREAQVVIEKWRVEYNTVRPHSALGYRPLAPAAFAPQMAARREP